MIGLENTDVKLKLLIIIAIAFVLFFGWNTIQDANATELSVYHNHENEYLKLNYFYQKTIIYEGGAGIFSSRTSPIEETLFADSTNVGIKQLIDSYNKKLEESGSKSKVVDMSIDYSGKIQQYGVDALIAVQITFTPILDAKISPPNKVPIILDAEWLKIVEYTEPIIIDGKEINFVKSFLKRQLPDLEQIMEGTDAGKFVSKPIMTVQELPLTLEEMSFIYNPNASINKNLFGMSEDSSDEFSWFYFQSKYVNQRNPIERYDFGHSTLDNRYQRDQAFVHFAGYVELKQKDGAYILEIYPERPFTHPEKRQLFFEDLSEMMTKKYIIESKFVLENSNEVPERYVEKNLLGEEIWFKRDNIIQECKESEDKTITDNEKCFDKKIAWEKELSSLRNEIFEKMISKFRNEIQNSELSEEEKVKILYDFSYLTKDLPIKEEENFKIAIDSLESQKQNLPQQLLAQQEVERKALEVERKVLESEKRKQVDKKIDEKINEIKHEIFARELKSNPDAVPGFENEDLDFYINLLKNEKGFQEWYGENISEYPNFCDWYSQDSTINRECNEKLGRTNIINEIFSNEADDSNSVTMNLEPTTIPDPEPTKDSKTIKEKPEIKNEQKKGGFFDSLIKMLTSWFG